MATKGDIEDLQKEVVSNQLNVLTDVIGERIRQDIKWGSQRHLPNGTWLAILGEEYGEVAKAMLEHTNLREELVQVAAVAVAWIEAIDSGEGK